MPATSRCSRPIPGDIYEDVSVQAVRDLREEYVPDAFAGTDARVLVGGETRSTSDFFNQSDTYMRSSSRSCSVCRSSS